MFSRGDLTANHEDIEPGVGSDAPAEEGQLARLKEHERTCMELVSLLHEHHSKMGTEESRILLEIGKRRWLRAKAAVSDCLKGR